MPLDYTIDTGRRLITVVGEYSDANEWRSLLPRVLDDR